MQAWIFQATGEYELSEETQKLIGDYWSLGTNFRNVREGDVAILWQAGPEAGVYAIAEIVSDPGKTQDGEWQVDIRYRGLLQRPILRADLLDDSVLGELQVIKNPHRANAMSVSDLQWQAISSLVSSSAN